MTLLSRDSIAPRLLAEDRARMIDFLATAMRLLEKDGLIQSGQCDQFRMEFKDLLGGEYHNSLLAELFREDHDLALVLVARYGEPGLATNMLRHSLNPEIENLGKLLLASAPGFLQAAEILFNKTVEGPTPSSLHETPLASFVLDSAEVILECGTRLVETAVLCRHLVPHAMAESPSDEDDFDHRLAHELDYKIEPSRSRAFLIDQKVKRSLVSHCETLLESLEYTIGACGPSPEEKTKHDGSFFDLRYTLRSIEKSMSYPTGEGLLAMEVRRQQVILGLFQVQHEWRRIIEDVETFLRSKRTVSTTTETFLDVNRRLEYEMVRGGHHPSDAHRAVSCLSQYCRDHGVLPKDLIESEFTAIDGAFSAREFKWVAKLMKGPPQLGRSHGQKKHNSERIESLKRGLAKLSEGALVLSLCFSWAFSSCGVKTSPISEVIYERPDIPIRGRSPSKGSW